MRCQNEVVGTVQFILQQIGRDFLNRLDRFPQQQNIPTMGIHPLAQPLEKSVGFRKPLTA